MCWALQPRDEIQQQAQAYYDGILTDAAVELTADTRVVMVHLRRGDYVGREDHHGLLTKEYYDAGIAMIRTRVGKTNPAAAKEGLVVVVMTEETGVEWCKENMGWGIQDGVKQTICATPKGKRCRSGP